jgi:ketopantoate reductase
MKAAVIGPGSMGLLYGSRLSACADVCLMGRSRDHVDEMNEKQKSVRPGPVFRDAGPGPLYGFWRKQGLRL